MSEATALAVDGLAAAPGKRTTGHIGIDLGPATVQVPVILVNGARPGPRVGVTSGIHGAEYVAIAALRRVAMSLDPAELAGSLVAVPIANPAAFAARSIYLNPLDGKNLNRVFPGSPDGSASERLANWLYTRVIAPSQRYIDMHCGDMNEALTSFTGLEETGDPAVDAVALAMAEAYGLDYMVFGGLKGSTTTSAAELGIPALLGEVGGQGLWPEADVARHAGGLRRALAATGLLAAPADAPPMASRRLSGDVWLRSSATGCFHPAVTVGEHVETGQYVGEVQDVFGQVLQRVEAPVGGEVLFLVTSLAMNAGDPLLTIGA